MNKATMSSLEIAKITGKRHTETLRAIRTMEPAWIKVSGRKFALADYFDSQGKPRPSYQLTKTECLYVATKFNDEARAKLILRWEALEQDALKVHIEYNRRLGVLEEGMGALMNAMATLTNMVGQSMSTHKQAVANKAEYRELSRAEVVKLVERAVDIVGSQVNLTNYMGVSESVISDLKNGRGTSTSKAMMGYIAECCHKVIATRGIPTEPPHKPRAIRRRNRITRTNLIADICKISDDNVRLSLLNKITKGHVV